MIFGRRPRRDHTDDRRARAAAAPTTPRPPAAPAEDEMGPWDAGRIAAGVATPARWAAGVLDLGSLRIPLPEGAQVQVEMGPEGPQAVHIVTPAGRLTLGAFSAPRSGGQWRHVAAEIAENLRQEDAGEVTIASGPWGREVVGRGPDVHVRFLGADGPRWMVRVVAVAPVGGGDALADLARRVLSDTVVVRGDEPLPVRQPLQVTLPGELAEQLSDAQEQARRQQAAADLAARQAQLGAALGRLGGQGAPGAPGSGADGAERSEPMSRRRSSAMQQLRSEQDEQGV